MKYYLIFALSLGACSSPTADSSTGAAAATEPATKPATVAQPALVDQKNGFRDHHFGDDLKTFADMELNPHQSTRFRKVYEKRNENKQIGTTRVSILRYSFYKNKFYSVDLQTSMTVMSALVSLYGPASQPNKYKEEYWWQGQTATATLQKQQYEPPWLSVYNNHLFAEVEAAEKAATQQAGKQASADL